jgi:hypothetical protein
MLHIRFASRVRTVRICRMNGWITTVSYNGYINGHNHTKCVIRCHQIKSDVDGLVVPPDDPHGRYNSFLSNPTSSGWRDLQRPDCSRMRPDGPRRVPDSFHLSFVWFTVGICIWHSSCSKSMRCRGRSTGRGRMVRRQEIFTKKSSCTG